MTMQQKLRIIVFFAILIVCFDEVSSSSKKFHRLVRMDRVEVCNGSKNAAFVIREIRFINPAGENAKLSMKAELQRELRHAFKSEVYVTRCLNKESLDTCIPFTVLKPISTCGILAMPNTAWSGLVNSVHPPFKCPLQVGPYEMVNGTVDADVFNFFPIDNYYWKAKLHFIEDDDYITVCADMRAIKVYV